MKNNTLIILANLIKDKFSYLFNEHGFEIIESKELRRFYSYYILAESNEYRIMFTFEANWGILFGGREKDYDGSMSGWIPIYSLFRYLGSDLPKSSPQTDDEDSSQSMFKEKRLDVLSIALEKDIRKIKTILKNPDIFSELQIS